MRAGGALQVFCRNGVTGAPYKAFSIPTNHSHSGRFWAGGQGLRPMACRPGPERTANRLWPADRRKSVPRAGDGFPVFRFDWCDTGGRRLEGRRGPPSLMPERGYGGPLQGFFNPPQITPAPAGPGRQGAPAGNRLSARWQTYPGPVEHGAGILRFVLGTRWAGKGSIKRSCLPLWGRWREAPDEVLAAGLAEARRERLCFEGHGGPQGPLRPSRPPRWRCRRRCPGGPRRPGSSPWPPRRCGCRRRP